MKCDKAQELFSDRLEGALERPMEMAFDGHLAECPECAREYAAFKMTWEMLKSMPMVDPPPGFATSVVIAAQMRRENERREKPKWQVVWSDLFESKVPVRAFAAAAAVVACSLVVLNTPLRGVVPAWIIPPPAITQTAPAAWATKSPWLNSVMSFELAGTRDKEGRSVFKLMLKPKNITSVKTKVYLMESGTPDFSDSNLSKASLIFNDEISYQGRVIPFVLGRDNGRHDVMTAVVEWKHRQKRFMEAVFVPVQIANPKAQVTRDFHTGNVDLYSALQQISSAYGVVILANADVSAQVDNINIENSDVDGALFHVLRGTGMVPRSLNSQVYVIDRQLSE